ASSPTDQVAYGFAPAPCSPVRPRPDPAQVHRSGWRGPIGVHMADASENGTKPSPRYCRVLLKLSGEAFCASGGSGINPEDLTRIAREIRLARQVGVQMAVVVGGGNFIRGATLARHAGIHQATAD